VTKDHTMPHTHNYDSRDVGPYVHQFDYPDDRSEQALGAGTHMCEWGCGKTERACRDFMCRGRAASEVCPNCGR
jgi:hypothetical protein